MAARKLSPGKIIIILLAIVFLLGVGTLALVGKRLTPSPYDCQSHTIATYPNFAGGRFTVIHTQCNDYTHKQFVSVYVQRFVAPESPFYEHWFNKPVVLFRYHPVSANGPFPVLRQTGHNVVQISVPRVSRIDDQRGQWLHLTIRYHIGHDDHPLIP